MPNPPRRRVVFGRPLAPPAKDRAFVTDAVIAEVRRREIYAALVASLKTGTKPAAARYAVARQFVLTVLKVEAIEAEGAEKNWSA